MAIDGVSEPVPYDHDQPFQECTYPVTQKIYLPVPEAEHPRDFFSTVDFRQSQREFSSLSSDRLSTLLWHAARTRASGREQSGYLWQHRAAPSAGGRHPIDLVISHPTSQGNLYLYHPIAHALCTLEVDRAALRALTARADEVMPVQQATIIWFAAQFERTSSRYKNADTLVWRDAGALLATISLVAAALNLNSCALGITGDPWLSRLFEGGNSLRGCGVLLVGEA